MTLRVETNKQMNNEINQNIHKKINNIEEKEKKLKRNKHVCWKMKKKKTLNES